MRITLEFHAHVERVGLHLLRNQADLIIPFVTERVFRIFMCLEVFVLFQIQPILFLILLVSIIYKVVDLSILTFVAIMVFKLCELVFVISPESSVDLIKPLQVCRRHWDLAPNPSKSSSECVLSFLRLVHQYIKFFVLFYYLLYWSQLSLLFLLLLLILVFIFAWDFEALVLELVMFDEFVGATIICISLVKNILANFIEILLNIQI